MAAESYKQKKGVTPGGRPFTSTTRKGTDGTKVRSTTVENGKHVYHKETRSRNGVNAKLVTKTVTRENYNSSPTKTIGRGPKKRKRNA